MLHINQINNLHFCSQSTNVNDNNKSSLKTGLAAVAALGITTLALTKGRTKSFEKALEKQGVTIKDGLAVVKDSGEKFSGAIKRNIKPFGLKKETVQFDKGIMTEKVYHDVFGREVAGEFYKNGKLHISVQIYGRSSQKKFISSAFFDQNGKYLHNDRGTCSTKESVFETYRKGIKMETINDN